MYFRRLNFKIPNCLQIPRKTNFTVGELSLDKINGLFNEFIDQAWELEKIVTKHGFEDNKQINLFKRYKEFYWKFTLFVQTVHRICFEYNNNISAFFKFAKNKRVKRRWFFDFKKKICKIISYKTNNFKQFFYKSRRPKKIQFVYPKNVRHFICSFWHWYQTTEKIAFMNFTNLWLKLCNKEILKSLWDFEKLSSTTLRKILNEDERTKLNVKLKLVKDHPFRNKPKPLGHLQLDFKVFGRNQTGAGKFVYCLDCIETQTRIPYSKVFKVATTESIILELEKIIKFYENLGIEINTIRTDNAMMFKQTNFVYSSQFNVWCLNNKIQHEFTPLAEPQCDGCVERYHKTLDDEVVKFLQNIKELNEINDFIQNYVNYYIYGRYFHYCELKHLPKKQQYMKPINAIQYFKAYNTSI